MTPPRRCAAVRHHRSVAILFRHVVSFRNTERRLVRVSQKVLEGSSHNVAKHVATGDVVEDPADSVFEFERAGTDPDGIVGAGHLSKDRSGPTR